jgi:hypothetical protein
MAVLLKSLLETTVLDLVAGYRCYPWKVLQPRRRIEDN